MTLEEFQEKLQTVSDQKLMAMLKKARKIGPESAEQTLVEEIAKRGLELPVNLNAPITPDALTAEDMMMTTPIPQAAWLNEESSHVPVWAKVLLGVVIFVGIIVLVIKGLSNG